MLKQKLKQNKTSKIETEFCPLDLRTLRILMILFR